MSYARFEEIPVWQEAIRPAKTFPRNCDRIRHSGVLD